MARIIDAFAQFLDDNGDPLVDGFLEFFESGSNNTNKDTFADSGLTVANTNPVQLGGDGRCPSVFGNGTYNVISYDSSMQQIQQFDPVGGTQQDGAFSAWDANTIYNETDIVTGSDGNYYRSTQNDNQNNDPTTTTGQWELIEFEKVWVTSDTYSKGDKVTASDGLEYVSRVDSNTGNDPVSSSEQWRTSTNSIDLAGTDTYTGVYGLSEYTDGMIYAVTFVNAATVTAPTVNLDALGALTVKRDSGVALTVGDITDNHRAFLMYDGTDLILMNPISGSAIAAAETGAPTVDGANMRLLASGSASGSVVSVDFADAFSDDYDEYRVILANLTGTTIDAPVFVRISLDSSTFVSSGTYKYAGEWGPLVSPPAFANFGNSAATGVFIGTINNNAGDTMDGIITFVRPNSANGQHGITADTTAHQSDTNMWRTDSAGHAASGASLTGFQIVKTAGVFDGGTIYVYGVSDR